MSADGSGQRALASWPERAYNPMWSPNGLFIAYFVEGERGAGCGDIDTMRADGSDQRPLTTSGDVVDSRMACRLCNKSY